MSEATEQLRVFVSHSSQDGAFCTAIVRALREADADVWYDEQNLGSGQLKDVILRELGSRPIFVVILSKAAMASRWVKREADWAEELQERDANRVFLPVTAAPLERNDFGADNGWLAFYGYKRIEAPGFAPYAVPDAADRLLRALALPSGGKTPALNTREPAESSDDLLIRGKALQAQRNYAEALPLFERATQLVPGSGNAWANLGWTLAKLGSHQEALEAYDRALAIDDQQGATWTNRGTSLMGLRRYDEALAAYDRALAIDPHGAIAWNNKGNVLWRLSRFRDAVSAYDRAVSLDPSYAAAWSNKALALGALGWTTEAEEAARRAKELRREHPTT